MGIAPPEWERTRSEATPDGGRARTTLVARSAAENAPASQAAALASASDRRHDRDAEPLTSAGRQRDVDGPNGPSFVHGLARRQPSPARGLGQQRRTATRPSGQRPHLAHHHPAGPRVNDAITGLAKTTEIAISSQQTTPGVRGEGRRAGRTNDRRLGG